VWKVFLEASEKYPVVLNDKNHILGQASSYFVVPHADSFATTSVRQNLMNGQ
jgi:hypothetical protein